MFRARVHTDAMIDEKGRLTLPSTLRRDLDRHLAEDPGATPGLVLTAYQSTLWIFTPQHYRREIEDRLEGLDPFLPEVRAWRDGFCSTAEDVDVDRHGRFVIPGRHRAAARLAEGARDVVLNTSGGHLELWRRDLWEERFAQASNGIVNLGQLPARRSP